VIAHSAHGAAELEAEVGIEPDRIRIVPLAVGDAFRQRHPADTVATTCRRYGVSPGHFLIAVGQVNDRKNLAVVLRALARLDRATLGKPTLLLAGSAGPTAGHVTDAIRDLGLEPHVRLAGYVPDADLPVLLGAARALVHPSHAEGFGFTPLEAMAAGVPALCSTAGALPEMVGTAGVLLDPDDVDAWAGAIERVLQDDDLRARLVAAGDRHQETFRWDRVAADTERIYAEVLGRP
jgi:alpha-1,3-rhamnosyl/mannosyltransferase